MFAGSHTSALGFPRRLHHGRYPRDWRGGCQDPPDPGAFWSGALVYPTAAAVLVTLALGRTIRNLRQMHHHRPNQGLPPVAV